jgi:hypothetical protein
MGALSISVTRDRPPLGWSSRPGPVRYWARVNDDGGRCVWHGGIPFASKKAAYKAAASALIGLSS